MRTQSKVWMCVVAVFMSAGLCAADSIVVGKDTFDNVYVRQTANMYYVQFPSDGSVKGFQKSDVNEADVTINNDATSRQRLLEEWKRQNKARNAFASVEYDPETPGDAPTAQLAAMVGPVGRPSVGGPAQFDFSGRFDSRTGARPDMDKPDAVTDGVVQDITIRNVPLRQALKAVLHPLNLDYAVKDGFVWVSTPERIRYEAFNGLETRSYRLRYLGSETLPKVVLRSPAGTSTGGAAAGGTGPGGGLANPGRSSDSRSGALDTGRTGGALGTGRTGGAAAGPIFSNISDLFAPVDDSLLGEAPPFSGFGGQIPQGGQTRLGGQFGSQGFGASGSGVGVGGGYTGRASGRRVGGGYTGGARSGQGFGAAGRPVGGANTGGVIFSNLSDLFMPFDDAFLFESPAITGGWYHIPNRFEMGLGNGGFGGAGRAGRGYGAQQSALGGRYGGRAARGGYGQRMQGGYGSPGGFGRGAMQVGSGRGTRGGYGRGMATGYGGGAMRGAYY